MLGRSIKLVKNFPEIDRWENGVATSIKSIDLGAYSYQNINILTRTVQSYVTKLAYWNGTTWANYTIIEEQIAGRELILAIPPNATQMQMQAVNQIQLWSQTIGVSLKIVIIP